MTSFLRSLSAEQQVSLLFVLLFGFMLIGMPIAVALGLSSLLTILVFGTDSLAALRAQPPAN